MVAWHAIGIVHDPFRHPTKRPKITHFRSQPSLQSACVRTMASLQEYETRKQSGSVLFPCRESESKPPSASVTHFTATARTPPTGLDCKERRHRKVRRRSYKGQSVAYLPRNLSNRQSCGSAVSALIRAQVVNTLAAMTAAPTPQEAIRYVHRVSSYARVEECRQQAVGTRAFAKLEKMVNFVSATLMPVPCHTVDIIVLSSLASIALFWQDTLFFTHIRYSGVSSAKCEGNN